MTASGAYVVRAQGDKKSRLPGYDTLKWPTAPGHTKSVVSDLAWNLAPLQDVAPAVADLVHIAAECDRLAKPCCDRHERIHGPQPDAYEHIADFARGDA